MIKIIKQLSPEGDQAGAFDNLPDDIESIEAAVEADQDLSIESDPSNDEEENKDLNIEASNADDTSKESDDADLEDDNLEADNADKDEDADTDVLELNLDDAGESNVDEEESDWGTIASELGVEGVEDNNFDSFKASFEKKLIAEREAGKAEAEKLDVEKYPPAAKDLISYLEKGGKFEEWLNPVQQFRRFKAMDDEALMVESLKAEKWDADMIETRIDELKSEGKLKTEAYKIRKALEGQEDKVLGQLNDKVAKLSEQESAKEKLEREKEDLEIANTFDKFDTFLDKKISPKSIEALKGRWKSGHYRELFSKDPEFVVKAILNHEFSEQVLKTEKGEAYKKGRSEIRDKVFKVPGSKGGKAATKKSQELQAEGLEAWEAEYAKSGVEGIDYGG